MVSHQVSHLIPSPHTANKKESYIGPGIWSKYNVTLMQLVVSVIPAEKHNKAICINCKLLHLDGC